MSEKLHQYCYENQYFIKPKLIWLGFCFVKTLGFILKVVYLPRPDRKSGGKVCSTGGRQFSVPWPPLVNIEMSVFRLTLSVVQPSLWWRYYHCLKYSACFAIICSPNSIINSVPQYSINIVANLLQINFLENFSSFNWFAFSSSDNIIGKLIGFCMFCDK